MNPSVDGGQSRWAALGGVAFVLLTIVAVAGLGGSTPSTGDAADSIRSFYLDEKARQFAAVFVLAVSVPFFLVYAATLASTVADEARRSIWQPVLLVGAGMMAVAWAAVAAIHFALTDAADQKLSDGALEALTALDADNWVLFNTAVGVFMLGAAGTLITAAATTGLRRAGWVALVLGVALFVPFADFFALLLSGLWIVVTSVMLFRLAGARRGRNPRPVPTTELA